MTSFYCDIQVLCNAQSHGKAASGRQRGKGKQREAGSHCKPSLMFKIYEHGCCGGQCFTGAEQNVWLSGEGVSTFAEEQEGCRSNSGYSDILPQFKDMQIKEIGRAKFSVGTDRYLSVLALQ